MQSNMAEMKWSDKDTHRRKKEWRKWVWNRAKERCPVPAKEAIILYLPGDDNADLRIAEQKGFHRKNMFGVERDPDIVAKLRQSKVNVIEGDFIETLQHWGSPKIDVVIGDFCCGFNHKIRNFIYALIYNKFLSVDAAIVINLMRGRDKFGKEARQAFGGASVVNTSHRGKLFFYTYEMALCDAMFRETCGQKMSDIIPKANMGEFLKNILPKVKEESVANAAFNAYKSPRGMWMDSVCFNAVFFVDAELKEKNKRVVAKIANAKAHRTMKTYL